MDNYNLLKGLGIPDNAYKSFSCSTEDNLTVYYVQLKANQKICPYCKNTHVKIKEYKNKSIKAIHPNGMNVFIDFKLPRYKCCSCLKTYTHNLDFMADKLISKGLINKVLEDCKDMLTFTQIGNKYDLSATQVMNIFDDNCPNIRQPIGDVVCIDEFSNTRKSEDKYSCIMIDFKTRNIIDIIKNRTLPYLREYFKEQPLKARNNVKFWCCDMYDGYITIAQEYFHNAEIVIDPLEVMIDANANSSNTAFMLVHSILLLLLTILIYISFYEIYKSYNDTIEMQITEIKSEKELEQLKLSSTRYEELHKLRDDLKNQFTYLSELVKNKNYDELQNYFADLKEQAYVTIDFFDCGNLSLNSIVNMEINKCKSHGCNLNLSIAVPKDYDFSKPYYISLLSNLIDNSIEEIERDNLEDKNINLKIYKEAKYIFVTCENKIPDNVTTISLKSKKKERLYHGYGTKIITSIASDHNGIANLNIKNGMFIADIMLEMED